MSNCSLGKDLGCTNAKEVPVHCLPFLKSKDSAMHTEVLPCKVHLVNFRQEERNCSSLENLLSPEPALLGTLEKARHTSLSLPPTDTRGARMPSILESEKTLFS